MTDWGKTLNTAAQQAVEDLEREMGMKNEFSLQAEERAAAQQNARSVQVGGDHYAKLAIQPIDFIEANNLGYSVGNIIKYLVRYKSKNGLQDLRKARHYLDMLIEKEAGDAPTRRSAPLSCEVSAKGASQ